MAFAQRSDVEECERLLALEDLHRGDLAYSVFVNYCYTWPIVANERGDYVPRMILQKMQAAIVVLNYYVDRGVWVGCGM